MKRIFLFSLIISFAFQINAQQITCKEGSSNFGKESYNSITTTIYYSNLKTVEKEFSSLIKEYKGKGSSKKGVITGSEVIIADISPTPISLMATITEKKDNGIELSVAFSSGFSFLSSSQNPQQFEAAKKIVSNFAFKISNKGYEDLKQDEEKKVNSLQKELNKTISNKEGLEKDNTDYKKKIDDNTKKIETYTKEIADQEKLLKTQKDVFDKIKNNAPELK